MKDDKIGKEIDKLLEEACEKAKKEERPTIKIGGDFSTTHIPTNWYSDSSKEKIK